MTGASWGSTLPRPRSPAQGRGKKRGPDSDGDPGGMAHSRGGPPPKTHAPVDAERRPIRRRPRPGQAGDAPVGTEGVAGPSPGATLPADRARDADAARDPVAAGEAWAAGPPRVIREDAFAFSPQVRRRRAPVERVGNRIGRFRGRAARHDRRPQDRLAAFMRAALRVRIAT